jgi:hypothetical protein
MTRLLAEVAVAILAITPTLGRTQWVPAELGRDSAIKNSFASGPRNLCCGSRPLMAGRFSFVVGALPRLT